MQGRATKPKWLLGHVGTAANRSRFGSARARRYRPGSLFDCLEVRRLLSALDLTDGALTYNASNAASDVTVSILPSASAPVASVNDADQTITLTAKAIQAGWSGSGTNSVTGPASSISSMSIGGTNAGQSLTLDFANGDPLPASGLNYDPEVPVGHAINSLTLVGNAFKSESYAAAGKGAGSITYTDSSKSNIRIAFINLSPVTDTVPSPSFTFQAPADATTVNIVNGPANTTQINDGGTGDFELINFANKTTATANVNNSGATTTVETTTASAGLLHLTVNSEAGSDTINVQATPSGVTTSTNTGSAPGSSISIGLNHLLTSINGPVAVESTGGASTLTVDDSGETVPTSYTLTAGVITATSFPTTISFSGSGLQTIDVDSSGASTVNLTGPAQQSVTTYDFAGGPALGANTLNVNSNVASLTYTTVGTLGFGAGQPLVDYSNFTTVNVTKLAIAPLGTAATISGTEGRALNNVVVCSFTEADLANWTAFFTATINWGDSTTTAGTITPNGTGGFQVTGSHTYAASGTYTVDVTLTDQNTSGTATVGGATINVTSNGPVSSTPSPIVSSADVGAAPLAAMGATVTGTAGEILSSTVFDDVLVATFMDAGTAGSPAAYTASINWGNGTTTAATRITAQGTASGEVFSVFGSTVYPTKGVYPITVAITKTASGATAIASGQAVIAANVVAFPLTVTGKLNPSSDSGASNTDDITNVVQPNFIGTTNLPDATISLYATASGLAAPALLIGTGVSDASGAWGITSTEPLPNGAYAITAIAVDATGHTVSTTTIVANLVIDTVGPKVTSVQANRVKGQIVIGIQDFGGLNNAGVGLNLATLIDANNYEFVTVHHPRVGKFPIDAVTVTPATTTGTQTVTLTIGRGKFIRAGWYDFTIRSVTASDLSGVQDIAGNALDGEFYGYFPSGNNQAGGDFVVQLTTIHHTTFARSTIVGRATPVSPPGTRQGNVDIPRTISPGKPATVSLATRRRPAQADLTKPITRSRRDLIRISQRSGRSMVATSTATLTTSRITADGSLSPISSRTH